MEGFEEEQKDLEENDIKVENVEKDKENDEKDQKISLLAEMGFPDKKKGEFVLELCNWDVEKVARCFFFFFFFSC